jgi:hypothetical protein
VEKNINMAEPPVIRGELGRVLPMKSDAANKDKPTQFFLPN